MPDFPATASQLSFTCLLDTQPSLASRSMLGDGGGGGSKPTLPSNGTHGPAGPPASRARICHWYCWPAAIGGETTNGCPTPPLTVGEPVKGLSRGTNSASASRLAPFSGLVSTALSLTVLWFVQPLGGSLWSSVTIWERAAGASGGL